jgi:MFS family permease
VPALTIARWLRAFRHRDFRLLWFGQIVSLTGTWMQSLGQSWLVLELTSSPFRLGLIPTLQFGPFLVLSFVAGAVADRLPKRRVLIVTQTALLLQAAGLATLVLTGHVRYWHVAALAAVAGVVNTLDMPARQALVVSVVGKGDLLNAIALNSAAFNAARVFGPAAAGFLIARYGPGIAFALNAASFVAVIVALLVMDTEGSPSPARGRSLVADVLEGVAYAARTPRIVLVLGLLFGVSLFVFNYNVLVPLLARDVLRQQAHGFGALMAMLGAGALTGAVLLVVLGGDRPRMTVILLAGSVVSIAMLAMAFVRAFGLAAGLLFVMGGSGIVFMTSCSTTFQLGVPDALRGRMTSLYTLVFVGVTPIGSLIMGAIAEAAGVPAAFSTGGGLGLAFVLGVGGWWALRGRAVPPRAA